MKQQYSLTMAPQFTTLALLILIAVDWKWRHLSIVS